MPVDNTHPRYDKFAASWKLVRDCLAGTRSIKEAGEEYLPRLTNQSDESYDAYRTRANFFNALRRTLHAFTGYVFRQNPEQEVPEKMAPFMRDATMTGKSFYDVERDTVEAALSVGRHLHIIDWQVVPEDRAFVLQYDTEDIINWRHSRINGKTELSLLVLREMSPDWIPLAGAPDKEPDLYDNAEYEQYREYRLTPDDDDKHFVQVTVWRAKNAADKRNTSKRVTEWEVVDQQIPTRKGQPLQRIPYVAHPGLEPREVPLESIAETNVSHYRTSADLENALHIAGVPTPVAAGFAIADGAELHLGTSKAWTSDASDAKAYWLAYDASMAAPLVTAMERKESQMAALGARILERQSAKGNAEAHETVLLRQGADHSALMTATISLSSTLSDVLQWVAWWMDASVAEPEDLDDKVYTELNTNFIAMAMDNSMLRELTAAYIAGTISYKTYFTNLQHGGIISSEVTQEDEQEEIDKSPNAQPAGGQGDQPRQPAPDDDEHDPTITDEE